MSYKTSQRRRDRRNRERAVVFNKQAARLRLAERIAARFAGEAK
jgi:hypothetical protein